MLGTHSSAFRMVLFFVSTRAVVSPWYGQNELEEIKMYKRGDQQRGQERKNT